MSIYDALELVRAGGYAVGVLVFLYLCIERSNLGDRPLAGMLGALSLLYGSLLMSVATRYMGLGGVESRTLITPAVLLHVVTGLLMLRRGRARQS